MSLISYLYLLIILMFINKCSKEFLVLLKQNVLFSRMILDQVDEHSNKITKGLGSVTHLLKTQD